MRHKINKRKLGRDSGQRKALFRKLVTDLLDYGKIDTTLAKAKETRPIAERIITLGKKGDRWRFPNQNRWKGLRQISLKFL